MRFGLLTDPAFELHESPGHVERPERLAAIREVIKDEAFAQHFERVAGRLATDEEIRLCHKQQVIDGVAALTESGGGNLDPDTYVNEHSDRAARLAVGGGIDLCRRVLQGEFDRGFALVRPPGHHSTPTHSMGFCLYSTVAVVAKACADLAQRILVFDWDVHHGNGTQDCLYDHGGTKFISFHQSPFYPGTGYPDERGVAEGEGHIYKVPLPAGCGDVEYEKAYLEIVRPVFKAYNPDFVIVSAGYDAHHQDLLGGMKVTKNGFARLAALVAEDAEGCAAKGRLVGFLEGGYHLAGLAESVKATLEVWRGQSQPGPMPTTPANDRVTRLLKELASRFEL